MHFNAAKTWKNPNRDPGGGYPILMSGSWLSAGGCLAIWTCRSTRLLLEWLGPQMYMFTISVNKNPTRCNSMQIFIYCKATLHVSGVTAPIIRRIKTVITAASGSGHNTGTATRLQRGLIGTGPDQAMEGSSCTSIMTCTGGCGYSF